MSRNCIQMVTPNDIPKWYCLRRQRPKNCAGTSHGRKWNCAFTVLLHRSLNRVPSNPAPDLTADVEHKQGNSIRGSLIGLPMVLDPASPACRTLVLVQADILGDSIPDNCLWLSCYYVTDLVPISLGGMTQLIDHVTLMYLSAIVQRSQLAVSAVESPFRHAEICCSRRTFI